MVLNCQKNVFWWWNAQFFTYLLVYFCKTLDRLNSFVDHPCIVLFLSSINFILLLFIMAPSPVVWLIKLSPTFFQTIHTVNCITVYIALIVLSKHYRRPGPFGNINTKLTIFVIGYWAISKLSNLITSTKSLGWGKDLEFYLFETINTIELRQYFSRF